VSSGALPLSNAVCSSVSLTICAAYNAPLTNDAVYVEGLESNIAGPPFSPAQVALIPPHANAPQTAPPMPPLVRRKLIDRADLELDAKELGKGAFGVVRKGRLRRAEGDIDVAVKQLDVNHVANTLHFSPATAIRAFYWEALNLALVDSPHIVEMVGVVEEGDFRAIVLEFCGGGTLQAQTNAAFGDIWRWATQLAYSLHYLHASGQVHRDIKSENVLLSADRAVAKWADLGVASADGEFVGDDLGEVKGFTEKDRRWAAPEEFGAVGGAVSGISRR
jgi:hypothetical protein